MPLINWTTMDEMNYAKKLYDKDMPILTRINWLKTYLHNCQNRKWYGVGMSVDPATVILQVKDWIADLMVKASVQ